MAARLLVSRGTTVLELPVVRQQSRRVLLREEVPERKRSRPLRVARMLAMAHEIERLIAEGAFTDRADAARKLGFTRARISQLLDLTLLAPDLQERLLTMETAFGADPITEHGLRVVVARGLWREQRRAWPIPVQHEMGGRLSRTALETIAEPGLNQTSPALPEPASQVDGLRSDIDDRRAREDHEASKASTTARSKAASKLGRTTRRRPEARTISRDDGTLGVADVTTGTKASGAGKVRRRRDDQA
jgi:hypothetical protein